MPLRSIKHTRGLAVPIVQGQTTALVQTKAKQMRKPRSLGDRNNALADWLTSQGLTVVDSQTIEP
jgi:hypothetical protein